MYVDEIKPVYNSQFRLVDLEFRCSKQVGDSLEKTQVTTKSAKLMGDEVTKTMSFPTGICGMDT
jgi:hypothetical protein